MQKAKATDVLYCDPPYVPLTESAYFTQYSKLNFPLEDQELLAKLAKQLSSSGVSVILSNHDTTFTRKIYSGATITSFPVSRTISCKTEKRIPVKELLAIY